MMQTARRIEPPQKLNRRSSYVNTPTVAGVRIILSGGDGHVAWRHAQNQGTQVRKSGLPHVVDRSYSSRFLPHTSCGWRGTKSAETSRYLPNVLHATYLTPQLRLYLRHDMVGTRVRYRLTPKEMRVVALIAQGCKNREIAVRLKTTEQVIKNYVRSIYDKIGVGDRLELALFTIHHRVLAQAADEMGIILEAEELLAVATAVA